MILFGAGLAVGAVVTLIAVGVFLRSIRAERTPAEVRSRAAHATALVEHDPEWDTEPQNVRILSQGEADDLRDWLDE